MGRTRMAYTREEIKALVDRLFSRAAEESGNQNRMFEIVRVAWNLKNWVEKGGQEPVPEGEVERARALLAGEALGEEQVTLEAAQGKPLLEEEPPVAPERAGGVEGTGAKGPSEGAQEAGLPEAAEPAVLEPTTLVEAPPESPSEKDLERALQDARTKAQAGAYEEAIALLKVVIEEAKDPYLKGRAEKDLQEVQAEQERKLQSLVKEARRAEEEEPQNLERQRKAWEAVLRLQPSHAGALEALRGIQQKESLQKQQRELQALRQQLRSRLKDVREVDQAIRRAEELKESREISDPRLSRELEQTLKELDELRNRILRESEGGASNERAGEYEKAIERYRTALAQGLRVIYDDATGEPLDVPAALERARRAYWQDLLGRASRRHRDAVQSLQDGYPEVAIQRLEEAQELLKKVEEGGEDARRQVDDALARAREEKNRKDQALQWVTEAQSLVDKPEEAWERLIKAKEVYPTYPNIQELLERAESRLAEALAKDAGVDLSKARGSMHRREYEAAREACNRALRRGANLSRPSEDLKRRWDEARALLEEIDREEQAYATLKRQMDLIRAALKEQNARRAKELLDRLSEEEQKDPEVQALRLEWSSLVGDDERYDQAAQFFYEREYSRVLEVCDSLRSSSAYAQKAAELRLRAQVRLWLQEARTAYEKGALDDALKRYEQMIGVESRLPEEDLPLVREAKEAAKRVREEAEQIQTFQHRLAEVKRLREAAPPSWEKWWDALENLRKENMPAAFRSLLEKEAKEGADLWRKQAEEEARQARLKGSIREAYQALKPLGDRRLISQEHREWRRVQFEYHKWMAERLLESMEDRDWEQAVGEARQALDTASEDRLQEAREFWQKALKAASLKRAQRAAVSANPRGAIELLEQNLSQYPFLREDPEVCQALLRYALGAREFQQALKQAQAMDYVRGQEGTGPWWQRLVQAVQWFAEGRRSEAVDLLADIEGRGAEALRKSPLLREEVEAQKGRIRDLLWQELSGATGDQTVRQILCLHLISRLQGGKDDEVERRLQAFGDRFPTIAKSLLSRVQGFSPGTSLQGTLAQARSLLAEAEAVREAADVVPGGREWGGFLEPQVKALKDKVARWEAAVGLLQEIEEAWRRAVQGTWDYQNLDKLYNQLVERLEGEEFPEVSEWRKKIQELSQIVKNLANRVAQVEEPWNQEDFERLSRLLSEISAEVTKAKRTLGEEGFAVPPKKLRLTDPYQGDTLEGIDAVRERVDQKRRNLEAWEGWKNEFDQYYEKAGACWQQIEEWLGASPPCLSRSKARLEELAGLLDELQRLAERQPAEALSGKAEELKEQWSQDRIRSFTNRLRDEIRKRITEVEEGLAKAEEPLERIRRFVRKGAPLSKERNRRTLEGFLEDLRRIDSCHPDLERYGDLLKRFGPSR
jgi:hypothetical protein